ncbi:hypothetical protein AB0M37_19640 [Micromonospora chalcea]
MPGGRPFQGEPEEHLRVEGVLAFKRGYSEWSEGENAEYSLPPYALAALA